MIWQDWKQDEPTVLEPEWWHIIVAILLIGISSLFNNQLILGMTIGQAWVMVIVKIWSVVNKYYN